MAIADDAVGNPGAEQGFDGRQQGDGDGRADQMAHTVPVESRQIEVGQSLGNAAEAGADGGDIQMKDFTATMPITTAMMVPGMRAIIRKAAQ